MPYVTPNSTLQLFKGINLDNRYLHTIYFASETAQNTWFTSKVFKTYNDLMYRRYESKAVRVEADATTLMGVTYLRFKNTRTGTKWFYAFVTGIEYVNENTTDIYYEIDVMQTWFIQGGSVKPCMVLREHVTDDTFGTNIEEEPIGSDVYDCDFITRYDDDTDHLFSSYYVIINSTGEPDDNELRQNGLFVGTKYVGRPANGASHGQELKTDEELIKDYLYELLGSWDAGEQSQDIIDMYTVPAFLITRQGTGIQDFPKQFSRPTSYDNYTPKNGKLMTYPYSFLLCTTHNGDGASYRWEYFDSSTIDFRMAGTHLGGGEIICYPRTYNGQTDNLDCKVTMSDFPKNPFVYDAYQAWVAMGGKTKYENDWAITTAKGASAILDTYTRTVNKASTVSGKTDEGLGFNIGTGLLSSVSDAIKTGANIVEAQNKLIYQFKDAHYKPNIQVGSSSPSLAVGMRELDFYFYHCHVRDDEVKRLDDFLSCYGYAVNKVKTPNLTGRTYWNFVQTENAVIAGDMPATSREAIGRIFDGGITFWHNGDQVGNYAQSVSNGSINNPILT